MARTLIYKTCPSATTGSGRAVYWDTDIKDQVTIEVTESVCSPYNIGVGVLLDSWCEGSTLVEAKSYWDGTGRPPRTAYQLTRTENAATCSVNSCGLKIDDVRVVQEGSTFTVTIIASGFSGAVEYSLNQFVDVQDSNVFTGLSSGSFIAYVRAKR